MARQSRNRSEQTWTQCFMKGAQDIRMGLQHQVCLALATIGIAFIGATARGRYLIVLLKLLLTMRRKIMVWNQLNVFY